MKKPNHSVCTTRRGFSGGALCSLALGLPLRLEAKKTEITPPLLRVQYRELQEGEILSRGDYYVFGGGDPNFPEQVMRGRHDCSGLQMSPVLPALYGRIVRTIPVEHSGYWRPIGVVPSDT